ncbi:hypothetical protein MARINOS108_11927 [Marinoscillum sp. 108]|nr:hypothetical protein MARINOS108_11927 [Marinoscillum sp. 108]
MGRNKIIPNTAIPVKAPIDFLDSISFLLKFNQTYAIQAFKNDQ